ncbi:regulatory protein, LuxR [Alloactinosynnema sp. L-07]|uniref:LuxR family transcriptional regulator n=1 Tax=Alloactinosynnema sp. L-07 TaxID=1653480 RepID=UPI00065F07B1|nr:LuxR family transcriptional regulator [Alloactinosynnema sp. L-07]CRK55015.1 regulatory protein, LuxR [Alloactinosynnema sp. L-07]
MSESPLVGSGVADGRAALSRGAWTVARACFERSLAEATTPEAPEGLSWVAWWLEDVAACLDARERAYRLHRESGDLRGAARMALWLGDDHIEFLGAAAVAEGWFGRARSLLGESEPSPEHGWLAVFEAHAALNRHDPGTAILLAGEARAVGRRHAAVDLEMFSLATEGLAMVERGEVEPGLRCLDEATAAALAGEYENLAPAAWTCCRLISACEQVRDYDRGAQWCAKVAEFARRMDTRFVTGVCRAHYAAILVRRGEWGAAERELVGAQADLTANRPFWLAEALVRLGDLRRRQGRTAAAERLFEQAGGHPLARLGLAELRLDGGDAALARDLLERMLRGLPAEATMSRVGPLELLIRAEIALGDTVSAVLRLEELRAVAMPTLPLRAAVCFAEGLVSAARGDHDHARGCFEDAVDLFGRGGAAVEAGWTRLELARSLSALGREDAARREARAALDTLRAVGAVGGEETVLDGLGLTHRLLSARQVQVLRLVAEGLGDREIAARLVLSEHTVHRHIANIYTRLDCSTRAAAVARAGKLGLL